MEKIIQGNTEYLQKIIDNSIQKYQGSRSWYCQTALPSFFNAEDLKEFGITTLDQQFDEHQFLSDIANAFNLRIIMIDVQSLNCTIFGRKDPFKYQSRTQRYNGRKKIPGHMFQMLNRRFSFIKDLEIPWIFIKQSDIDSHGNKLTNFFLLPIKIRRKNPSEIKYTCDWKIGLPDGSYGGDALFFNQLYFIRTKTLEMHSTENKEVETKWQVHGSDPTSEKMLNTILDHLLQGSHFEKHEKFKIRLKCLGHSNRKRKRSGPNIAEQENRQKINKKRKKDVGEGPPFGIRVSGLSNRAMRREFWNDSIDETSSSEDLDEDLDLALWQGRVSKVPEEDSEEIPEEDPAITLWSEKISKMREKLFFLNDCAIKIEHFSVFFLFSLAEEAVIPRQRT